MLNGDRAAHCNGSAQSKNLTTPQSTSIWLDVGKIGQGMEKRLHFVVHIFWNFCQQENFKAHLNCNRKDKFDHSAQFPPLQTPQSIMTGCGLGWKGEGAVAPFFQGKISEFSNGEG